MSFSGSRVVLVHWSWLVFSIVAAESEAPTRACLCASLQARMVCVRDCAADCLCCEFRNSVLGSCHSFVHKTFASSTGKGRMYRALLDPCLDCRP